MVGTKKHPLSSGEFVQAPRIAAGYDSEENLCLSNKVDRTCEPFEEMALRRHVGNRLFLSSNVRRPGETFRRSSRPCLKRWIKSVSPLSFWWNVMMHVFGAETERGILQVLLQIKCCA